MRFKGRPLLSRPQREKSRGNREAENWWSDWQRCRLKFNFSSMAPFLTNGYETTDEKEWRREEYNVRGCYPTSSSSVVVVVAHGAASWLRLNDSVLHSVACLLLISSRFSPTQPCLFAPRRTAPRPHCVGGRRRPATHQRPALGHLASTRRARVENGDRGYTRYTTRQNVCVRNITRVRIRLPPYVNGRSNNRSTFTPLPPVNRRPKFPAGYIADRYDVNEIRSRTWLGSIISTPCFSYVGYNNWKILFFFRWYFNFSVYFFFLFFNMYWHDRYNDKRTLTESLVYRFRDEGLGCHG